jgi:hypothetical protein
VRQEPLELIKLDRAEEFDPLDTGIHQAGAPLPALQRVHDFGSEQDLAREEGELKLRVGLLELTQPLQSSLEAASGGGVVVSVQAHRRESLSERREKANWISHAAAELAAARISGSECCSARESTSVAIG